MSFQANDAVRYSALKGSTRLLAYELATLADKNGASIFPSVVTLAECTGLSRQTIHRHLNILEESGVLIRDGKSINGVTRWHFSADFMSVVVSNDVLFYFKLFRNTLLYSKAF